jgi:predicted hydrolase (HD superfamily)
MMGATILLLPQHTTYGRLLEGARRLLDKYAQGIKPHLIATGATMRALALQFGGDPDTWEIAGMLHDLDWDQLNKDYEKHCGEPLETMLAEISAPPELLADIRSHYQSKYGTQYPLDSLLRCALYTCEELTGFIIAVALVRPSRKLFDLEVSSVKKKLKDKAFAAQVDREQIKKCEEILGLPLDELIKVTIHAMKGVSGDIGL